MEQSDLGQYCLQYRLPKQMTEQKTKVVTGWKRVKFGQCIMPNFEGMQVTNFKLHCIFGWLISFLTYQSTIFQLVRDRSYWVKPVLSKDKCVLLKDTTLLHRDAGNARTGNSSISRGCLDLPERLELPERPPKYRKDQRIYSWTILCTRDQTNLRLTRDFTAAIKVQASLPLPHAPSPIHSAIFFNSLIGSCNPLIKL